MDYWGLLGSTIDVRTEVSFYNSSDISVEKTENNILVSSPYGTYLFDEMIDFRNISDSTTFYVESDFNIYNIHINRIGIFYYTDNKVKKYGDKIK